jgi:hypothetical protein
VEQFDPAHDSGLFGKMPDYESVVLAGCGFHAFRLNGFGLPDFCVAVTF